MKDSMKPFISVDYAELEAKLNAEMLRVCNFLKDHFGGWPKQKQGEVTGALHANGFTNCVAAGGPKLYIGVPGAFYLDEDAYNKLIHGGQV